MLSGEGSARGGLRECGMRGVRVWWSDWIGDFRERASVEEGHRHRHREEEEEETWC